MVVLDLCPDTSCVLVFEKKKLNLGVTCCSGLLSVYLFLKERLKL